MNVKENKAIWSFELKTFSHELNDAFRTGWVLVEGSVRNQIIPPDRDCANYRERYFAVVEKQYGQS